MITSCIYRTENPLKQKDSFATVLGRQLICKSYLDVIVMFILTAIPIFLPKIVQAQREQIWLFGKQAGLNFNNGAATSISSAVEFNEAAATVCDLNGQLQFSTNGEEVWDKNGARMPNGFSLPGYTTPGTTSSTSQGALIVPMPDSAHKYYIFSLTCWEMGKDLGRLYYSVVNMNLNGGLGDVEPNSKGIFLDSLLTEHLTGVVGNQCNLWVIVSSRTQMLFKSFEITASGVNRTPIISTPGGANSSFLSFGRMTMSPDRTKMAIGRSSVLGRTGSLELYRFNPFTGLVSDPIFLDPSYRGYYGIAFSEDNSKLYANASFNSIVQYDLSSGNADSMVASRLSLESAPFTDIKRAPDGKIYFGAGGNSLSQILKPNIAGIGCQISLGSITLKYGSAGSGFPNLVPSGFRRDTSLKVQKQNAGCFAAATELKAIDDSTGWGYSWNNGSSGTTLSVTATGDYWVSYHTPPCVLHTDTFKVLFPAGNVPQISSQNSCISDHNGQAWIVPIRGDTVVYQYAWSNQNSAILSRNDTLSQVAAGNYFVRVTTSSGCDTTIPFSIIEEEHHASFTMDSLICEGRDLTFLNQSDSHFLSFTWNFGDGNHSLLSNPAHTYFAAGHYVVQLIGKGPVCTDTSYGYLYVDAPFEGLHFSTDRKQICTGETLYYTPVIDSTTRSLQWNFGDGSSIMDFSLLPVQHAYDISGTLPLTLSASFRACPDRNFTDSQHVYPIPKIDLGPDSSLCLDANPLTLFNAAPNASGTYAYYWSTGATTEKILVKHQGIYSLSLRNAYGCTGTETIKISKDCYTDIPNAFSPDNDGINDYFFPRQLSSRNIIDFNMQIFNRWGQIIFQTSSKNGRGWDGKCNGREQPEGVYVYHITVQTANGDPEMYNGNITLIR